MEILENLESRKQAIVERLSFLNNSPKERVSAYMNIPIHSKQIIVEIEKLDEELGKISAQIHLIKNPGESKKLELIRYGHNHIIETHIENGIVVKGGMLESYFNGRVASEHEAYVRGRHNKISREVKIISQEITTIASSLLNGTMQLHCFINEIEYKGTTSFVIDVNESTYFYFSLTNCNIERDHRGLSAWEKELIKYICAMNYRDTYKKNCNINFRF